MYESRDGVTYAWSYSVGLSLQSALNIISLYPRIRDVIITLGQDASQRSDWPKIHTIVGVFESFDFIFNAHLMLVILGYTSDLSDCLQRRDQDILSAMAMVRLAKDRIQELRSNGWDAFLQRVTLFCNKHSIQVPTMEDNYVPYGRSTRFVRPQTNDDHFRREVFLGVIDQISQELENRFDEINMELLSCMSALNPANSFAAFDAHKVCKLAEFYSEDFSSADLIHLELQLGNYIGDMRKDENFQGLGNLVDLSVKLVQTGRHIVHNFVYLLLKLVLILPVETANVERAFSAMSLVKNKLRNKMGDSLLDDCLVTYIEWDIFSEVNEDDIIDTFMAMQKRRPET